MSPNGIRPPKFHSACSQMCVRVHFHHIVSMILLVKYTRNNFMWFQIAHHLHRLRSTELCWHVWQKTHRKKSIFSRVIKMSSKCPVLSFENFNSPHFCCFSIKVYQYRVDMDENIRMCQYLEHFHATQLEKMSATVTFRRREKRSLNKKWQISCRRIVLPYDR